MQTPKFIHLAFALVLPLSGGSAFALDSARDSPAVMTFASDERAFINEAAQSAKFELEASRLAATQSKSPAVRRFAEHLIRDHDAARASLKEIADEKQFSINDELTKSQASQLQKLITTVGAEFDRMYVQKIGVDAHQSDVKNFSSAARSSRDKKLKDWATRTLPILERHLGEAKRLR